MSEEFALCWNNFTENITTGFQSLLVGGELCDVTLAVDGKLMKAHKVVLSICSPYFQEMFTTIQPNQHPVLVLKDMSSKLVSNLLEFMYKGLVNVKQEELQAFMKIAETLQIKGLTTSTKEPKRESFKTNGAKRGNTEIESLQKTKDRKIDIDLTEDDVEQTSNDQFHIIPFPEISMVETRDLSRDSTDAQYSSPNLKISESRSLSKFGSLDSPNETVEPSSKGSSTEYPNEPSGSNITMLSSTSLLHGNCIFNRNNTVATQAGLKTYWLCKSYRISMCKARCITHQGKVISATGIHNHLPHMSDKPQEIPPGHAPNVIPTGYEFPSSFQANMTGHHPITRNMMSHTNYSYYQQPDSMDQLHNVQVASPENDAKTSFDSGSNHVQFKMEHI